MSSKHLLPCPSLQSLNSCSAGALSLAGPAMVEYRAYHLGLLLII